MLGNGSVNKFPRRQTMEVLLETAFSVRPASRQYNEDPRPPELITGERWQPVS
jgi:hypothetical protein